MPEETAKPKRRRAKPQPSTNLANNEIDSRLAQAIRDRAKAMHMVSKLTYWQDRLMRVNQEIESLIQIQQRMTGQVGTVPPMGAMPVGPYSPPIPFSHMAPIPEGVGSIPAKQPHPNTPNVADKISGEGGFS